ncbi:hypothetical protein ES708_29228 [subsurface metagenome]
MSRTVIDLFAGGGGLSVGFLKAGFEVVLGLDNWRPAKVTFEYNHPGSTFLLRDAHDITGDEILRAARVVEVDVLLGGPPCQGFSTAGKRALDDPRNALVRQFLRLVAELHPKFVVMENVEGFVSFVGGRLVDEVVEVMGSMGYKSWQRVLQAADYGVPQKRKRFFLVATPLPVDYSFPKPTHLQQTSLLQFSTLVPLNKTVFPYIIEGPLYIHQVPISSFGADAAIIGRHQLPLQWLTFIVLAE